MNVPQPRADIIVRIQELSPAERQERGKPSGIPELRGVYLIQQLWRSIASPTKERQGN